MDWSASYAQQGQRSSAYEQPLTLSPQMLFLERPAVSSKSGHISQVQDSKPVRWEHSSYDQYRRESVASNISSTSKSSTTRRRESASPASFSMESKGSPASSSGESSSSISSHVSDISEMSAAPFCSSFSGIFGLTTECFACSFRYDSVHELAEHQRMVHGVADVIF